MYEHDGLDPDLSDVAILLVCPCFAQQDRIDYNEWGMSGGYPNIGTGFDSWLCLSQPVRQTEVEALAQMDPNITMPGDHIGIGDELWRSLAQCSWLTWLWLT